MIVTDTDLARFVDRYTMEHVRFYPHPIERVWRALTEPEHLRQWLGRTEVDLRVGGTFAMHDIGDAVITALDAPRLIEFGLPLPRTNAGFTRYELTEVEGGCRMVFTHHFEREERFEDIPDDVLGGDLPGGPDTPWRPGFVGGWHDFFDRLGFMLDGRALVEPRASTFVLLGDHVVERMRAELGLSEELAEQFRTMIVEADRWNELNDIYREHIRATIPQA